VPVLAAAFLQLVLTDLLAPFFDQTSHDAFLWTQRTGRSKIIDSLPVTFGLRRIRRNWAREKNPASLCRNGLGGKRKPLGISGTPLAQKAHERHHVTKRQGSRPRNASGNALLGRPRTRKGTRAGILPKRSSPSGGPLGEHGYRSTGRRLFRGFL
jgi:hypothetical protein